MSTENTKITEVSASTENTSNDNKKVFGPLGKYAIVAVIMVSIIVTTALMLNKQLGSVDEQLAAMESEVAEIHATDSGESSTSAAGETVSEAQDTATTETVVLVDIQETEEQLAAVEAVEAHVDTTSEVNVALTAENTLADEIAAEAVTVTDPASNSVTTSVAAESKPATEGQTATAQTDREQERLARIETYKLEQKQRMSEMFARIKTLEAQRLDDYRTSQDEQIARLREQISRQEQLIEALILRNKEWLEMREASMQRSQSHREEMLDRI